MLGYFCNFSIYFKLIFPMCERIILKWNDRSLFKFSCIYIYNHFWKLMEMDWRDSFMTKFAFINQYSTWNLFDWQSLTLFSFVLFISIIILFHIFVFFNSHQLFTYIELENLAIYESERKCSKLKMRKLKALKLKLGKGL